MDRIARLLHNATKASRILEIGAGYCPVAPKAAGWQTHVVDQAPRDALRQKYTDASVDLTVIEDVDTIWQSGPLHEAIPASLLGRFDLLIASHVLEHLPDLIGFLNSAQQLLTQDGAISIALPDRRFCFDYFRPAPTTGALLEAHAAAHARHGLRIAWDQTAYAVTIDGALAWGQHSVGSPSFVDAFSTAEGVLRQYTKDPGSLYADYHVWPFTPAGFKLAILELGQIGAIDWHIASLHGPERFEFFALLVRGAKPMADAAALQACRMALLREQLIETAEQAQFAAGQNPGTALASQQASLVRDLQATVAAQRQTLQEMQQVLRWSSAALRPLRVLWRSARRVWAAR